MEGDYGTFEFGWDSMRVTLNVDVAARFVLDLGWDSYSAGVSYHNHSTFPVVVVWHLATNDLGIPDYESGMFDINTPIPCAWDSTYNIVTKIRPQPRFYTVNSFAVDGAGALGGAWLVTPDPWDFIPDAAVFVAAKFLSPLDGEISMDTDC
jgi:hypothetical protein